MHDASLALGNIAFAAHDDLKLMILCHGRKNPTDAEWEPYVALLSRARANDIAYRILVVSEGGHPTRSQQARMNMTLKAGSARVAVLSPSVAARFVTSILVLSNPDIQCFSPDQRALAYAHLGMLPSQGKHVDAMVAQLQQRIG